MQFFTGNALWQLVNSSDFMTKIILTVLFAVSLFTWTILFYKTILLRVKVAQIRQVLQGLKGVETLEQLIAFTSEVAHTYPGYLLISGVNNLKTILKKNIHDLGEHEFLLLEEHRINCVEDMVHQEESYLAALSTASSAAPLIGLFGTVWGLIHSFMNITQAQSADIITIAPGVTEALLTTLVGLVVAIPALVMYHYLRNAIDSLEYNLHLISSKVHTVIKMAFIKTKEEDNEITIVSKKTSEKSIAS